MIEVNKSRSKNKNHLVNNEICIKQRDKNGFHLEDENNHSGRNASFVSLHIRLCIATYLHYVHIFRQFVYNYISGYDNRSNTKSNRVAVYKPNCINKGQMYRLLAYSVSSCTSPKMYYNIDLFVFTFLLSLYYCQCKIIEQYISHSTMCS